MKNCRLFFGSSFFILVLIDAMHNIILFDISLTCISDIILLDVSFNAGRYSTFASTRDLQWTSRTFGYAIMDLYNVLLFASISASFHLALI